MPVINKFEELIGSTPLFDLRDGIFAKLEFFNPAGSIKDRAALYMINEAEKSGKIKAGDTLIEPTSGNTGIGLAAVGASRGYHIIITMPDTMSKERIKLMELFGAKVMLTEGALGMSGAIAKAEALAKETGGIVMGQFVNPANALAHYETTGPEIWRDTDGKVDILISAVGTGGTVTGTGRYLKEQNPDIKIIGVEPASSPVLSGGEKGAHKIQGIGAGFVPEILDTALLDEVVTVTDDEAYEGGRALAKEYGLLVGISSGAAYMAAKKVMERPENRGKTAVVIFPDSGTRYLSTEGYY